MSFDTVYDTFQVQRDDFVRYKKYVKECITKNKRHFPDGFYKSLMSDLRKFK